MQASAPSSCSCAPPTCRCACSCRTARASPRCLSRSPAKGSRSNADGFMSLGPQGPMRRKFQKQHLKIGMCHQVGVQAPRTNVGVAFRLPFKVAPKVDNRWPKSIAPPSLRQKRACAAKTCRGMVGGSQRSSAQDAYASFFCFGLRKLSPRVVYAQVLSACFSVHESFPAQIYICTCSRCEFSVQVCLCKFSMQISLRKLFKQTYLCKCVCACSFCQFLCAKTLRAHFFVHYVRALPTSSCAHPSQRR